MVAIGKGAALNISPDLNMPSKTFDRPTRPTFLDPLPALFFSLSLFISWQGRSSQYLSRPKHAFEDIQSPNPTNISRRTTSTFFSFFVYLFLSR